MPINSQRHWPYAEYRAGQHMSPHMHCAADTAEMAASRPSGSGAERSGDKPWDAARAASSSDNPPSGPTSAIFHIGMSAKTSERPMDAPSSASITLRKKGVQAPPEVGYQYLREHCPAALLNRLDRRLLRRASGLSFLYNRHRRGRLEKDNRGYTKLSRLLYDKLGLVP